MIVSKLALSSSMLLVCAAAATLASCARSNPDRVTVDYEYLEERDIHSSFTEDGLLLEEFDIDRDGVIDNWVFSQPLDEHAEPLTDLTDYSPLTLPQTRLVRREIDLNFDGDIDLIKHYDYRGQLLREEVDSDFSGTFERTTHFTDGIVVRRELDLDENGVQEERRFYIHGKIFRVEMDEDQDGKTDYWQFYTDGVLTRAGHDRDGDGVIDEWLQEHDLSTLRAMERHRNEPAGETPSGGGN